MMLRLKAMSLRDRFYCMIPRPQKPVSDPGVSYAEAVAAYIGSRCDVGAARSWPTTHTLFCDETGNSGSRFNDPDQPLYAEGGWLVPHAACARLAGEFAEIETRFGYTPKTKGTRIKDSATGRSCIAAALEMLARDATPFFYVVEKRYFICAKAVETYFDPKYNPSIDPVETFDPRLRTLRADLLYGAPDAVVAAFADSFRQEDHVAIARIGADWANAMAACRQLGLATQLRVSLPMIAGHMEREFAKLRTTGLPKGYATLNAPSLAQAFQLIERSSPPCDMIHDQCDSLAAIYRYFFDRYRNAEHDVLPKLDGSGEIFGFRRLNSLSFGDSEMLPLLRASDYLLASCVDLCKRAVNREEIPVELRDASQHGLARMMNMAAGHHSDVRTSGQIGEIMASDMWISQVAESFFNP